MPDLIRIAIIGEGTMSNTKEVSCSIFDKANNWLIFTDYAGSISTYEKMATIANKEDIYWFSMLVIVNELLGETYGPGLFNIYRKITSGLSNKDIEYADILLTTLVEYFDARSLWHQRVKYFTVPYFPFDLMRKEKVKTYFEESCHELFRVTLLTTAIWLQYYGMGYYVSGNLELYETASYWKTDRTFYNDIRAQISSYYKCEKVEGYMGQFRLIPYDG